MNEIEFARFVKDGLGSPADSQTLATRVATAIRLRSNPNSGRAELGLTQDTISAVPRRKAEARSFGRLGLQPRVAVATLTLAVIGGLNLVGAYFFPSYGEALANAPVVGGVSRSILSGTGLLNAEVSPFNEASSSNGHTLRLIGAYADGLQTIFFVEIDGQSLATAGPPRKSDHYLVVGTRPSPISSATAMTVAGHPLVTSGLSFLVRWSVPPPNTARG